MREIVGRRIKKGRERERIKIEGKGRIQWKRKVNND